MYEWEGNEHAACYMNSEPAKNTQAIEAMLSVLQAELTHHTCAQSLWQHLVTHIFCISHVQSNIQRLIQLDLGCAA